MVRLLIGPTAPDRVIAVDALGAVLVLYMVMLSIQYGREMLLDVALAFTILSFIGTLVVAKYLEGDKLFK